MVTDLVPSSVQSVLSSDAEMGAQLTEQYHRAIRGMHEVLRFGAMVLIVEESRCQLGTDKGPLSKGEGLKGWLAAYAPEVSYGTARRFRDVARSVAAEYEQIAGRAMSEQFSLTALVTADPESLPEPAREQREKLLAYVSGTSQQSWLNRFGGMGRGGDVTPRDANGKRIAAARGESTRAEIAPKGWSQAAWDIYRTLDWAGQSAFDGIYLPALKLETRFEAEWAHLPDTCQRDLEDAFAIMHSKLRDARLARAARDN